MFDLSSLAHSSYILGAPVLLLACKVYLDKYRPTFEQVPTIGRSGRLTSYIDAVRYLWAAREIVQEGYRKYPRGMFKIPTLMGWEFVISGGEMVEDLRKAGEELSFLAKASDDFRFEYTVKGNTENSFYHVRVARANLMAFGPCCDYIHDEGVAAIQELTPNTNEGEWYSIPVWNTVLNLVARMSNRVFVGLPLCRDPEYLKLVIGYPEKVMTAAYIINLVPKFLHPIIAPLVSPFEKHRRLALKFLGPTIEERLRMKEEHGKDWEGKPDDLISWLIDEAKGEDAKIENLALRVIFVNFAVIHTTSMVMTHTLFDIAAHPEYIEPLREEAREVTESQGWSKAAIAKLYKMDSFVHESVRYSSLSALSIARKVVDPNGFTFSNGMRMPYGTHMSVVSDAVHHDEEVYPDSQTFDGFRFYKMAQAQVEGRDDKEFYVKHAFTSLSASWNLFGVGRHACPGRFFSAHEIKATVAYILLNHDIKLRGDRRPDNQWIAHACVPDVKEHILLRKRV